MSTQLSICTLEEEVSILCVSTSIRYVCGTYQKYTLIFFKNFLKKLFCFLVDEFGMFVRATKIYINLFQTLSKEDFLFFWMMNLVCL